MLCDFTDRRPPGVGRGRGRGGREEGSKAKGVGRGLEDGGGRGAGAGRGRGGAGGRAAGNRGLSLTLFLLFCFVLFPLVISWVKWNIKVLSCTACLIALLIL